MASADREYRERLAGRRGRLVAVAGLIGFLVIFGIAVGSLAMPVTLERSSSDGVGWPAGAPAVVHCGPAGPAAVHLTEGSRQHPELCDPETRSPAWVGAFASVMALLLARQYYVLRRDVRRWFLGRGSRPRL